MKQAAAKLTFMQMRQVEHYMSMSQIFQLIYIINCGSLKSFYNPNITPRRLQQVRILFILKMLLKEKFPKIYFILNTTTDFKINQ